MLLIVARSSAAEEMRVAFDIPSKVECHDVTQPACAAAHPTMKVIEARFRISANFVDGGDGSSAEFVYMISSPDMRLKILGFLPDTTLESSAAGDRIEVTDSTESTDAITGDVRVGYSVLSLSGSKNSSTKKTESNHYQRVAPQNLVLASGTVNRGHGVFYKLRPSHYGSLEGAKEFVILCVVPKTWRGDWCSVICSARTHKKSRLTATSSTAITGIEQAHVGLYMSGDREASELADEMTEVQSAHGRLLSKHLSKEALRATEDLHGSSSPDSREQSSDWPYRVVKMKLTSKPSGLETAKKSLLDIESQFIELASTQRRRR